MQKKIYLFSFATALWLALSAFYSGPTEAPSRMTLSSSGGLSEFYPVPPPPLDCPPGDVGLYSQAEVDAFVADYPNCTEIAGRLILGLSISDPVNDISGLSGITSITGSLFIGNSNLASLEGLNNLVSVGADENLISVFIYGNESLADIDALSNLTSVPRSVGLVANTSLTNLNGFSNLNSVGGFLIQSMPALTSLAGLDNITSYGIEGLGVLLNPALSSLDGLNSTATFGSIGILNNPLLSVCDAPAVCNHLAGGGEAYIENNAPGCSSVAEVEAACDPTVDVCGAIAGLIAEVEAFNLDGGLENALTSKLENALSSFENGNNNAAAGKLGAFINQVEAQSGKKINSADAAALIATVEAIISAIDSGDTDCGGAARVAPVGGVIVQSEEVLHLEAFPNPFTQQTTLQYYLPADGRVRLSILSIHGQEVAKVVDGQQDAGLQRVEWENDAGLPAGVYFARLQTDSGSSTLQLVLAR